MTDDQSSAVDRLLGEMTLPEKLGQMAQIDVNSITPAEIADLGIGSVLSGGGGNPEPNDPARWKAMVDGALEAAAGSRLGIPLLYGVDAVHGHSNVRGATVFPHQIGLGATGDPDLIRRVYRATAVETAATGVRWDFAPCLAVPHDLRWGRSYEGFGRDPALVGVLGAAAVEGLQGGPDGPTADPSSVLACPKHYVGDGGTEWGTARRVPWNSWWDDWPEWHIDQGDVPLDEADLRRLHLDPYREAIESGAATVMASYSSWRGDKMHGHRYLLDRVLRGELEFRGPVVSDWMGIDQLGPDYRRCIVESVNAGVDVVMVPLDHQKFLTGARAAVEAGEIPIARIDEAVRRILGVKAALGLLDRHPAAPPPLDEVGSAAHRTIAREAARRSVVRLYDEGTLPIPAGASVAVAGPAADDVGYQCGGWTIEWQGSPGPITPGTTLLEGLRETRGDRVALLERSGPDDRFDVGVYAAAEEPYAEGMGDRAEPELIFDEGEFARLRAACRRLILVVYSGRPVVLPAAADRADAVVAAWLPGTEGGGVADVLVGLHPFTGRLPQPWPASIADLGDPAATPRWPMGHG